MEIKLGKEVTCKVTGFKGIVTAKVEYLNGCVQYCIKPKAKNNAMPDSQYIDVQQLEVIGEGIKVESSDTGGDNMDTPPMC